MTYDFILYLVINTLVVLATAPLFVSLIKKVKAWTQGRQGPSVFQTYYTLIKAPEKGSDLCVHLVADHAGHAPREHGRDPCCRPVCAAGLRTGTGRRDREYHPLSLPACPCQVLHGPCRSGCRQFLWRYGQFPGDEHLGHHRADNHHRLCRTRIRL